MAFEGTANAQTAFEGTLKGNVAVRVAGSEREIPAQLVLIACGFTGPEAAVLEAFGVHAGERGLPLAGPSVHRADAAGETPVFLAGDVRTGSSLVVNAISDAVACAGEVAAMLEA